MEKQRIGISQEYAVIIKKKTKRGTTYEAASIIKGFYDADTNFFVDEEGECYLHFDEYEPTRQESEYFLGRLAISEYLNEIINKNYSEFSEEYLSKFKKYYFQCRSNGIICVDKESNKRYLYEDDNTIINREITIGVAEQLTEIIEGITEQITEQLQKENSEYDSLVQDHNASEQEITINKTPYEIVTEMKEYLKGQDEAIIATVTNLYQYLKFKNGAKNNMIIVGPSGVGKTFIFEVLAKILDLPLLIYSVPGLSQSGYVGKSVDEIITQLIASCNGDVKKAEQSIIILDEIDKIATQAGSNTKIGDGAVQNELLKLIEGDKRLVSIGQGIEKEEVEFDTSKIIFIGTGAFQEIFEETTKKTIGFGVESSPKKNDKKLTPEILAQYGIKREMIGRMPIIIQLRNLEEQDLCDIIMNGKESVLRKAEQLITQECGIQITNLNEMVHKIARDAINKNIGARGIKTTVANLMNKIYYEIFNYPGEYDELTFGENILTDPTDFKLTKKVKGKVRKLVPNLQTEQLWKI